MRRRDGRTLVVFVLIALFSSLLAVTSPLASAEPGDVNSISGTITRPNGVDPARGIKVTGELQGGGDSFTVVTGSDGTYSAVGLTAGNWIVKFEDIDNKTLATEWYNGSGFEGGASPIVVNDGVPGENLNIDTQLLLGAAITGTIFDNSGGRVAADMSLYINNGATLVETTTADSNGFYKFRGLYPETYQVCAEDPNFGVTGCLGGGAFPGNDEVLTVGEIVGGRNITLPGGRIEGAVTVSGSPAAGIPVSFDGGGPVPTVFTGTDGSYESPFLANDTYTVDFGPFGSDLGVVVNNNTQVSNGVLGATDSITGTVTSGGAPLSGIDVTVTNGAYTTMVETAANGTYTAYVPPAFAGTVDFTSPNYVDVLGVAASAGDVVNRSMTANPGGNGIPDGTTIQTSGIAVNGLPRISPFVGPWITHGPGFGVCAGGEAEVMLDDGVSTWSQQMDELDPADYRAKIPRVLDLGLGGTTVVTITVTCPDLSVDVTEFSVYVDPAGRVLTTEGLPVFAATVTLLRDDPSTGAIDFSVVPDGSAVMDPNINNDNPDLTDAAGWFRWDLAPGTYKVTAEKAGCHAPGDELTTVVETAAFSAPGLGLRITLECPPPPIPETPDDNPEVAPGTDCPSEGALDPFLDVSPTSFARIDITCIFQLHVTTGTSPTTYSPANNVTREQMASFLARMYKALTGANAPVVNTPFLDLNQASAFAVQDIARIYGLGVTTGTSPTTYSPKDFVTREQMASFLARLFKAVTAANAPSLPTPFTDVSDTSFAKQDIGRIYGLGITTGTSPTTYSPANLVTREQMASFLARLFRAAGGELLG